ncbi:PEGA domain-containing protein [Candidatus Saccharibacteria bacterium]|nr:PEGA domain-containing protein [Candidatus Saccharibacteria bacterium]
MQEEREQQQRTTLILGIIVGAVVVGAVIWYILYNVRYSARLELHIAPNNALIYLNDKEIRNRNQQIRPGEHVIRVEREGFETQEEEFSVAGGETFNVSIALLPSDGNLDWYNNNPRDALILDGVRQREQDRIVQDALNSDPIFGILPFTEDEFGLKYVIEAAYSNGVRLLIRLNTCSDMVAEYYKEQAFEWLRSQGFEPNNYHIDYMTLCG